MRTTTAKKAGKVERLRPKGLEACLVPSVLRQSKTAVIRKSPGVMVVEVKRSQRKHVKFPERLLPLFYEQKKT